MQFIKQLAIGLVPAWDEHTPLSIACISTTNPVYLVFHQASSHPALVIRSAETESVCLAHEISEKLFNELGGLVPEPIGISSFDGLNFAVQKGVKGLPWFQLAQSISSPEQWATLRRRAITALDQLHAGAAKIDEWQLECHPGKALRSCLEACLASGTVLSQEVKGQVEAMSQKLDRLGVLRAFPQHGDYCLNNLIVADDGVHIIDFEDFGMTHMPLHDEFSLALSFYAQAPKAMNSSLLDELKWCSEKGADYFNIDSDLLPAFFMYHLLLRLGKWSQGGRRDQYRAWLMTMLDRFTTEPQLFFK